LDRQTLRDWVHRETGCRPRKPRDQRYKWIYIFCAVCPARGVGAALILPHVKVEAMNLSLTEISTQIAPGAHAVIGSTALAGINRAASCG
jgi:hypothetical protein